MHILSIFYAYFDILSAYFICIFLAYFHAYFLHICHIACIFLCIFLCIFHAYFMHILYIFYAYIMHIQHFSCIFSCRFLAYCMHISCMFMSYLSYILHLYTYFMHIWYKSWFDWPSFPVTVVPFKFIVVTVSYSEFWGPCHCPSVDIPPPAPIACSEAAPCLESHTAPGYDAESERMEKGIVPVSPTGISASLPRIEVMGTTYKTCLFSLRSLWRLIDQLGSIVIQPLCKYATYVENVKHAYFTNLTNNTYSTYWTNIAYLAYST